MNKPTLSNEEAAEFVTNIKGWVCKTCRRFYGEEEGAERMARYCCEKDHACGTDGCLNRAQKSYTVCDPCRKKMDQERYLKLKVVDWDGDAPLVVYHDDRYFFDVDDLVQWLEEDSLRIEDVELVIAEKDSLPVFDMADFLCDYLCEDNSDQLDSEKIDKIVNRWIEKNAPTTWVPSDTRPSIESLKKYIPQPEKS